MSRLLAFAAALVCHLRGHEPIAGRICGRCLRPLTFFDGRWWRV